MPLIAVPNVSEGRDAARTASVAEAAASYGARVLDIHSDPWHNRSVLTLAGTRPQLVDGVIALADASRSMDMTQHTGIHPFLGGLDVCPFVPHRASMSEAVDAARAAAHGIGETGLPVFLYGDAARRDETRELPDLRRGGLPGVIERVAAGLVPDEGPAEIDPRTGVVCVGARGPLIAFNVVVDAEAEVVRAIANAVRRPGLVRALAMVSDDAAQISMNLIAPERTGIDAAFETVEQLCGARSVGIVSTEIVGLVEERFLPDPDAPAARLLLQPGRSLESAMSD